jgi:peptidoglycan/LPS O-acetylase OafA/YrhL
LSGFLIGSLLLGEKERSGTISLSRFYVRRAFRILPPMAAYVVTVASLERFNLLPPLLPGELSSVLLFYRNFGGGTWYTAHFWSLAVEEQFYIFVPMFVLLLSRRSAIRVTGGLIVACVATRLYEFSHDVYPGTLLQFRTENRCDGLLWGVMLALALRQPGVRQWLRKKLSLAVFGGTIAVATSLLLTFESTPVRRTIVAMTMPVLLAYTTLQPSGVVGRVLEHPAVRWVGRMSYSLYIWQMMFLVEGDRPLGPMQSFPLALLLPCVCAVISYYLIEKPMIRIGHRLAAAPALVPDPVVPVAD